MVTVAIVASLSSLACIFAAFGLLFFVSRRQRKKREEEERRILKSRESFKFEMEMEGFL